MLASAIVIVGSSVFVGVLAVDGCGGYWLDVVLGGELFCYFGLLIFKHNEYIN